MLSLDSNAGTVKISLRGAEILQELISKETKLSHPDTRYERCHWVPEYGSWMIEATPEAPYAGFAADLLRVEQNMKVRRARLLAALKPNEICPTVPCFPLLGVGTFTEPPHPPGGPTAQSLFVPDALINPHPRFPALTANIRERRGAKVDIRVPRFRDTNTPHGVVGAPPPATVEEALKMDEVYMDAMAFGMGCCCLQVTFQACDVGESRHLYDQLAVLSPSSSRSPPPRPSHAACSSTRRDIASPCAGRAPEHHLPYISLYLPYMSLGRTCAGTSSRAPWTTARPRSRRAPRTCAAPASTCAA